MPFEENTKGCRTFPTQAKHVVAYFPPQSHPVAAAADGFQKKSHNFPSSMNQLQQKVNVMNEIPRSLLQRGMPPVIAMQKLDSIIYANRQIRRLEKKNDVQINFRQISIISTLVYIK